MSSGRQACADDEDDHYHMMREAGIPTNKYRVYSYEASIVKKGLAEGFTKDLLIEFVELYRKLSVQKIMKTREDAEFAEYKRLQEKFKSRA
jgi:hypothetical protein